MTRATLATSSPSSTLARLRRVNPFHLALVLVVLLNAVLTPVFFTPFNLLVILSGAAALVLVASGATLVILTGRIDISVGSTMFLAGGVFVVVQEQGLGVAAALCVALATGAVLGALNGLLIAVLGLSALLTTLGMMLVVRGLGLNVIGGKQHALPPAADALRDADVLGLPLYVLVAFGLAVLLQWVLSRTLVGRRLVAVGCDDGAAVRLGISVRWHVFGTYVAASTLAALAGVVAVLNLGGVQTYLGKGQEFVAIAAAVIGGVSLFGGMGTILPGLVIGVLFLVVIENGLNLAGISPFAFPFFTGIVILVAMYADSLNRRRP